MEFISLARSAQIFGERHLLYTQMELLSILKRQQRYKKLRKTELDLKQKLKIRVMELKKELSKFDKILPQVQHKELIDSSPYFPQKQIRLSPLDKKIRNRFEREAEEIKRKIELLSQQQF